MKPKEFAAKIAEGLYGMHPQDAIDSFICINCNRDGNKEKLWYSPAGEAEYHISALCEYCFDEITRRV